MTAVEPSLPEATDIALPMPQTVFSNYAELQLGNLGELPNVLKNLFQMEYVSIRLLTLKGNWIRTENGVTLIEDRNGGHISDFTLASNEVVCISDTQTDPRILNGTIRNGRPDVKSYIGRAIQRYDGSRAGVFCVWGTKPRKFSTEDLAMFEDIMKGIENRLLNSKELDRASEIQRGMLPQIDIVIFGYELAGFCQQHLSVGGDFYDWVETSDGVAFTLADVMGKGIGSAIIAATVRATIRAASWNQGAEQVMNITSQVLEPDLQKAGVFVTLVHAQLNTFLNRVRYIDAGHGLAAHVRKDGTITKLVSLNYPIGVGQNREWQVLDIEMGHGDTLILVSDGVLDIYDNSIDPLKVIADIAVAANSAQEIIDELKEIVSNSVVSDDVTVLILRRT